MSAAPGTYVKYSMGPDTMSVTKSVFSMNNNTAICTRIIPIQQLQEELSDDQTRYYTDDKNDAKIVCVNCESENVNVNYTGAQCSDCNTNVNLLTQSLDKSNEQAGGNSDSDLKDNNFDDICEELLNSYIKQFRQNKQEQFNNIMAYIDKYLTAFKITDVFPNCQIVMEYNSPTKLMKTTFNDNYAFDKLIGVHLNKYKSWFRIKSGSQYSTPDGFKFIIRINLELTEKFQKKSIEMEAYN